MAEIRVMSRRYKIGKSSSSSNWEYWVRPYSYWPTFAASILGGVFRNGRQTSARLPARDPGARFLFAQDVAVEGLGHIQAGSNYSEGAKVTVTYGPLDQDTSDSGGNDSQQQGNPLEMATENLDVSAKQLTLPGKFFRWGDQGDSNSLAVAGMNPAKTIPYMTYTLTRQYVPYLPLDAIASLLGKVNAGTFTKPRPDGQVSTIFPPEVMRFDGARSTRKFSTFGYPFYEVTYIFGLRYIYDKCITAIADLNVTTQPDWVGWNRLFRPQYGAWQEIFVVGENSQKIYALDTDGGLPGFSALFR